MGRIDKDMFGKGFTVTEDGGSKEHFEKSLFGDDFVGDKGTRVSKNLFDNGLHTNHGERIDKKLFGKGYRTSSGTEITPDLFGDGYSTRNLTGGGKMAGGGVGGYGGSAHSSSSAPSDLSDYGAILFAVVIAGTSVLLPFVKAGWFAVLPTISIALAFLELWILKKRVSPVLLFLWSQPLICLGWFRLSTLLWVNLTEGSVLGYIGVAILAILLLAASNILIGDDWGIVYIFPYGFLWLNSLPFYHHAYGYGCIGFMFAIAAVPTLVKLIKYYRCCERNGTAVKPPCPEQSRQAAAPSAPKADKVSGRIIYTADDISAMFQDSAASMRREYAAHNARLGIKAGKNDPCPCGSRKKYKSCCGRS